MRYIVDIPKFLSAIEVAKKAHAGQKRKVSGRPYFHHPLSVALIIISFKKSGKLTEIVLAAILHDTLEDTDLTFDKISKKYGPLVASLVLELTNDKELMKKLGKKEYQRRKFLHMTSYALLAKLADRLHNVTENPTPEMKRDTLELMEELLTKRSTLTRAHRELIKEIQEVCRS